MHASVPQPLTWIQRLIVAGILTFLLGGMSAVGLAAWLSHEGSPGIVPAPVPVAPAAPVEPAPLPPTVVIPDNA